MASPLVFGGVLAGAYYLYKKFNEPRSTAAPTPFGPTTTKNGISFKAQVVSSFADGSKMVDVFTTSGSRIVRFSQQGSDRNSRVEVISPPGVDPSVKAAAMAAYGVRPKA